MQKYVLVFPYNGTPECNDVMLIRKAKPEWQKGRLNLVGGKVEPGESFFAAAEREFREETGLDTLAFDRAGTIRSTGSDFIIGVFTCETWREHKIISEELEPVDWYDWYSVKDDPALMDNLKVVIPLLLSGMEGWTVLHGRDEAGRPACFIEWEHQHAHV